VPRPGAATGRSARFQLASGRAPQGSGAGSFRASSAGMPTSSPSCGGAGSRAAWRPLVFVLCASLACATAKAPPADAAAAAGAATGVFRADAPGAKDALHALWAAAPFALPAARLALASGGVVPRMHKSEVLLNETSVRLEAGGQREETLHLVWRLLGDEPDQTISFTWAPWHQDKPQLRARVVLPDGQESWLDERAIVEGVASYDDLQLSDVHQLHAPMPNARRGTVIELLLVQRDTQPLLQGEGGFEEKVLWSRSPVRRRRIVVDAPAGAALKLEAVGIELPKIEVAGGRQRVRVEVGELEFKPLTLTLSQFGARLPRFSWSTASSWDSIASRYQKLVEPAFADPIDLATVEPLVASAKTTAAKAQAVMGWVSERVRYTAVHLGDGAIVPTLPSKVLARGYGDCKDLSVLVASVLRRLGVPADVALASTSGHPPRAGLPGLESFDHMIVAVPGEQPGERLWVDATAPSYPVGVVPEPVRDSQALIVSTATRGLVPTPTRAQTPLGLHETYQLNLAPFSTGSGHAKFVHEGYGAAYLRARTEPCDQGSAQKLVKSDLDLVFGEAPYFATVTGCKTSEGPFTLEAEVARAPRLETTDTSATVNLPARVLDWVLSDALRGTRPGSDQRDEQKKKDDDQKSVEETGLTEAELAAHGHTFDYRPVAERTYRLSLPEHFVLSELPAARTIQMGPATWTESFTQPDPKSAVVTYRFETEQVEWTLEDVTAFQKAYWKRFDEPPLSLVAKFEPLRLLEEKRPQEAVALMKKWLGDAPKDGLTRARYARTLLQLGLGDLAKKEAARALADSPTEPLALIVCGDTARHNAFGQLYLPPYERELSIDCFKRAHAALPDHSWATRALADTLWRNSNGEPEKAAGPDTEAAIALLVHQLEHDGRNDDLAAALSEIYSSTGDSEKLIKLFESQPSLRKSMNGNAAVVADTLIDGVDQTLLRLQRIEDPKQRFVSFAIGFASLAGMGRDAEAIALADRFKPGEGLEPAQAVIKKMSEGLKPVPDSAGLGTAELAARSVMAMAFHTSTPTAFAQRLFEIASPSGRLEQDGTPKAFRYVRIPVLDNRLNYQQLYHRGVCVTAASGAAARVRCELPESKDVNLTSYWRLPPGNKPLQLESLGSVGQLAARAWAEAKAGRLEEAGTWIGWVLDEMQARGRQPMGEFLASYWSQADHKDRRSVTLAAAAASLLFSDRVRAAPKEIPEALDKGRASLSGALARSAAVVTATAYEIRGDHAKAFKIIEPLARSENEPELWRRLARIESHLGRHAEARARVEKALAVDPGNIEWRLLLAEISRRAGRSEESLEVLEKLRAEKGDALNLTNNLLWSRLMAGRLDEDTEREASKASVDKNTPTPFMHTAAMILLERSRLIDAANVARRRQLVMGEMDDGQWLFRGRLLELLQFGPESREAYAKVGTRDEDLVELARRWKKSAAAGAAR
jgi:tetratricopeptide (TPR) repeat protein